MAKSIDIVGTLKSMAREVLPTIDKLKKIGASLSKGDDQRRSLGDKAEADLATWKKLRDEAFARLDAKKKDIMKRQQDIEVSMKIARDSNRLSLSAIEDANQAIVEMVALGKQIEAAKKKGDAAAEQKLQKQLSAKSRTVEAAMNKAAAKVGAAHTEFTAARTKMVSYTFPS